jgi:NitT/TauT family transport system permease protein
VKQNSSPFWVFAGIGVFILLWELAARISGSELLVPGPLPTAGQFAGLLHQASFYRALGSSFIRVLLGLLISIPIGIAAGLVSALDKRVFFFLKPFLTVISAAPVLSIILIAFLWFGSERTPVFTGFLLVFPVMTANTQEGLFSIDSQFRELFFLYKIPFRERLCSLYLPAILPFIRGGIQSSLSLCWKVVVASEVLVQPFAGLGTGMQRAKAGLETAELFAWTLASVAAAGFLQALFAALILLAGIVRRNRRRP